MVERTISCRVGVTSFADDRDPVEVMNVALECPSGFNATSIGAITPPEGTGGDLSLYPLLWGWRSLPCCALAGGE